LPYLSLEIAPPLPCDAGGCRARRSHHHLVNKRPSHDESCEEFRAKRANQQPPREGARRDFATHASRRRSRLAVQSQPWAA
jgi:hypothetical protein